MALVLGAGCSVEDPTGLKLSHEYSLKVHARLVADGLIEEGEFEEVEDLSALAEFVFGRTGSQKDIVTRLPREDFSRARPNSGYLDAVALMMEGAVSCVITLNYDRALTNALVDLGARGIGEVTGSETVEELGAKCVIYLHGHADRDADDWILRKSQLEEAWENTWQDLVAIRVSTTPFLVFVGLGSPAAILTESVARVRQIGPGAPNTYLVNPGDTSPFAAALSLPESNMVQLTWCEFMARLAERVVREYCEGIKSSATDLLAQPAPMTESGRFDDLVSCLQAAGLRTLGRIRAIWLCNSDSYYPDLEHARVPMAQLLLSLGEILDDPVHEFAVTRDGRIQVSAGGTRLGSTMGLHGAGVRSWALARQTLRGATATMAELPDLVLATGFTGPSIENLAPPDGIVHGSDEEDIVTGRYEPRLIDIDGIRGSGRVFEDLVA